MSIGDNTQGLEEVLSMVQSLPEADSGGIDTSDANATDSDMAQGVTAYVNGQKITGNVITVTEDTPNFGISARWDSTVSGLNCDIPVEKDMLLRDGITIKQYIEGSSLGNATASDVLSGKTFTSSSGAKITGTYTPSGGGSGLPSGISKLDSGTYTPTSDIEEKVSIQHGLGVNPDFVVIMVETPPHSSDFPDYLVHQITILQEFTSATSKSYGASLRRYGKSDGSAITGSMSTVTTSTSYSTTSVFYIVAGSTYKLKSGVTYKWVVGKFS